MRWERPGLLSLTIWGAVRRSQEGCEAAAPSTLLSRFEQGVGQLALVGRLGAGEVHAARDLQLAVALVIDARRIVEEAIVAGTLDGELLVRSQRRRLKWAQWAAPPSDWRKASTFDVATGHELSEKVIAAARGNVAPLAGSVELVVVDDDAAFASAPQRDTFGTALRAAGFVVSAPGSAAGGSTRIVAVFGDVLGGKGRAGYAPCTVASANSAVEEATAEGRRAVLVQFGHPRLAGELRGDTLVTAWSGERAMQEAVARWLARKRG